MLTAANISCLNIKKFHSCFTSNNEKRTGNAYWRRHKYGCENIKENFKTSAKESLGLHELKQHKPWFNEECLGLLDQRKQAKMQWLQDPSQINEY